MYPTPWFRTAVVMAVLSGCSWDAVDRSPPNGRVCTSHAGCDWGQVSAADGSSREELDNPPLRPGAVIESGCPLASVGDTMAIADHTTNRGSLFIKKNTSTTETSLRAPQSQRELEVHDTDLENLSLPALHTATPRRVAICTYPKLERVEPPTLTRVEGRFASRSMQLRAHLSRVRVAFAARNVAAFEHT